MAIKNFTLNPGGIVVGFVCGIAVAAYMLAFSDHGAKDPATAADGVIIAALAGGLAGNFVWGLIFKAKDEG